MARTSFSRARSQVRPLRSRSPPPLTDPAPPLCPRPPRSPLPLLIRSLTAFATDPSLELKYSGHPVKMSFTYPPLLRKIQDLVEERTGCVYNHVMANLYEDGGCVALSLSLSLFLRARETTKLRAGLTVQALGPLVLAAASTSASTATTARTGAFHLCSTSHQGDARPTAKRARADDRLARPAASSRPSRSASRAPLSSRTPTLLLHRPHLLPRPPLPRPPLRPLSLPPSPSSRRRLSPSSCTRTARRSRPARSSSCRARCSSTGSTRCRARSARAKGAGSR